MSLRFRQVTQRPCHRCLGGQRFLDSWYEPGKCNTCVVCFGSGKEGYMTTSRWVWVGLLLFIGMMLFSVLQRLLMGQEVE